MKAVKRFSVCLYIALIVAISNLSYAQNPSSIQRPEIQAFINMMVQEFQFDKTSLTNIMQRAQYQPQIIELMEKPGEKKPWDSYNKLFLTSERIEKGIAFWRENEKSLRQAEQQYGVPANIIVAIIGIETFYGKKQGSFRVLDALTTLAFNYPKRSAYFLKELKEFFLLCREHQVSPELYLGSYAGAMGKPQFMPSSYRHYAAHFSNKNKKDLMNDNDAVIASIANYFYQHGWKTSDKIAEPAHIVGNHYRQMNTTEKKANYTLKECIEKGIYPLNPVSDTFSYKAGLIELIPQAGSAEYWLAYPNFYVITRYNTSVQYAMTVFLLSQQLKQQWAYLSLDKDKKKSYA